MTGDPASAAASPRSGLRRWKFVPFLALGVGIVVWLAGDLGGPSGLGATFRHARPSGLVGALVALATTVVLSGLRFRAVLAGMGHPVPLSRALSAMLAAWPLSLVAPSKVNDLLRADALRDEVPPLTTIASVLAERVVDLESLCLLSFAGAARAGEWHLAGVAGLAAFCLIATVLALLRLGARVAVRLGRFRDKVERLLGAASALLAQPAKLVQVTAWSLGAWIANVAILFELTQAFDAGLTLGDAFALWPVALFAGLLPVTLGGLGTRDAAFVFLVEAFAQNRVPRAPLVASSLGYAILTNAVLALVGVPFMASWWAGRKKTLPVEDAPP